LPVGGGVPYTWNLVTLDVEGSRALDVVTVALLVAMQVADVAGDQLALDVVPGTGADAIACIDTGRVATLFLAEIRVPSARGGLAAQEHVDVTLLALFQRDLEDTQSDDRRSDSDDKRTTPHDETDHTGKKDDRSLQQAFL
jgi:hypothetical protein